MHKELAGICKLVLAVLSFGAVAFATPRSAWAKGDDEGEGANLGPGCAPERPAIAHHAGGVVVGKPRGTPPIPCATRTGFRTSEISMVITKKGTILFQPAFPQSGHPIGVIRSVDQGATWEFIDPKTDPPRISSVDMTLWTDQRSGRVYWSNDLELPPGKVGPPPRVDLSDDDGKTWFSSSPLPNFHYIATQIVNGPPVDRLGDLSPGSPDPVYVCTAGSISCPVFNFCGKHCAKSSDNGLSFGLSSAVPFPPECPFPGFEPTGAFGLNGVVARDGTVYQPLTPCERPYIAISGDEGNSWQLVLVADTETIGWGELGLGLDDEGNLYATWTDAADHLLYLAISRDRGRHWSKPLMIATPGVNEAAEPQLVAGARGQVAVAYYGSRNAPIPSPPDCITASVTFPNLSGNGVIYTILLEAPSVTCRGFEKQTWNTYVTETWNALDRRPLFWSATLNAPDKPTWYGATPSSRRVREGFAAGHSSGLGAMDYFAMTMARDKTAWVGFVQECPFGLPVVGNPNCPGTLTGAGADWKFGMVGRLVRVGGKTEDKEDE